MSNDNPLNLQLPSRGRARAEEVAAPPTDEFEALFVSGDTPTEEAGPEADELDVFMTTEASPQVNAPTVTTTLGPEATAQRLSEGLKGSELFLGRAAATVGEDGGEVFDDGEEDDDWDEPEEGAEDEGQTTVVEPEVNTPASGVLDQRPTATAPKVQAPTVTPTRASAPTAGVGVAPTEVPFGDDAKFESAAAATAYLAQTDNLNWDAMPPGSWPKRHAAMLMVQRDLEDKYAIMRAIIGDEKLPSGVRLVDAIRATFDIPGRGPSANRTTPVLEPARGVSVERQKELDALYYSLADDAQGQMNFLTAVSRTDPDYRTPTARSGGGAIGDLIKEGQQRQSEAQKGTVVPPAAPTTRRAPSVTAPPPVGQHPAVKTDIPQPPPRAASKGASKGSRKAVAVKPPPNAGVAAPPNPMLDKCENTGVRCDAPRHQHQGGKGQCFKPDCGCRGQCGGFVGKPIPTKTTTGAKPSAPNVGGQGQQEVRTAAAPAGPKSAGSDAAANQPASGPTAEVATAPAAGPTGTPAPASPAVQGKGDEGVGVAGRAGEVPRATGGVAESGGPIERPQEVQTDVPVMPELLLKMITNNGGGPEGSSYFWPRLGGKERASGPGSESRREKMAIRVRDFWNKTIHTQNEGRTVIREDLDLKSNSYRVVLAAYDLAAAIEGYAGFKRAGKDTDSQQEEQAEKLVGQMAVAYRDAHKPLVEGQLDTDWAGYNEYLEAFKDNGLKMGMLLHEWKAEQSAKANA
jgi:hypothetical protein